MTKKIMCAMLSLVLVAGLCPAAAFADGTARLSAAAGRPTPSATSTGGEAADGSLSVCDSRTSLAKCKVKLAKKAFKYTGKKIEPKVTVKYKGKKLKVGRDYTVAYKNNKLVGTAKAVVKGKGRFRGEATKKFKIVPAVDNGQAKAALAEKARRYAEKSYSLKYRFFDLDGDGVSEMLLERAADEGMWRTFLIYAYRAGKVKRVHEHKEYGEWNDLDVYRKSRGFVEHGMGHGGESYQYYKMKGGKYRLVASASRYQTGYGWSSYTYRDGSGSSITWSSYHSKISAACKGKARALSGPSSSGWGLM